MMGRISAGVAEGCRPFDYATAIRAEIGSRAFQQDHALIRSGEQSLLAILCDGMGGTEQGGMASQRTADAFRDLYSDAETCEMAQKQPVDFLRMALKHSDHAVSDDAGLNGSGTTLTSLLLVEKQAYWASVGDSRLYILRGDEMMCVTRDHNYRLYLDELMKQKRIGKNRYAIEVTRGRALISYIGIGGLRLFDLTQNPMVVYPGDIFLLTSDGLTGLLPEGEIQSVLCSGGSLELRADRLMGRALTRGQNLPMDNTTFALIEIM